MELQRALMEMLRVSGSVFILFWFASALGLLLLTLLLVSLVTSLVKRHSFLKKTNHYNLCGRPV